MFAKNVRCSAMTRTNFQRARHWGGFEAVEQIVEPTGNNRAFLATKGLDGDTVVFKNLHMAATTELVSRRFALVAANVNEGHGSHDSDRVYLTSLRLLDGTAGYPLDTGAIVQTAQSTAQQAAPASSYLEQASQTPEGDYPRTDWTMVPPGPNDGVATYVTWHPESAIVEIRCRQMSERSVSKQIGTRRVLVHSPMYPYDPPPGLHNPPPPPPPPHWETVPRVRTLKYGAAVDMTFMWRAGHLTHGEPVAHLWRYHVDSPQI
jgi:hypothetical protein